MFRKTVLTSAIVGVGLASSAGAAFAGDDPGHGEHRSTSHSSSHETNNGCVSGAGSGSKHAEGVLAIGSILDVPVSSNVCDVLNGNGNGNGSGNTLNVGGSTTDGEVPVEDEAPATAPATQAAPAPAAPSSQPPAGTTTVTPIR